MNKLGIIRNLKKVKYTEDQLQLMDAIEKARVELELARRYFEEVKEPKLVDFAIYNEQAIKARYGYLIDEARKMGLVSEPFLNTGDIEVG